MPQSLVLLKSLPDENYLHDLQAEGVLRASMNFLPGGCYAGAALYDASPSYLRSSSDGTTRADRTCPDPNDTVGCLLWEALQIIRKLSSARPLDFNAFLFLELEAGSGSDYVDLVRRVGGEDNGTTDYVETEFGLEYVAAAHLIGCGSYGMVVEVLAQDHGRMLDILHQLTDVSSVKQYSVGRLAAADARGFGEPQASPAD